MENVTLNQKEQVRLQILNSLLAEHMTVDQAAMLMGVSTRHTRRILAAYREEGAAALAHGHRGRRAPNTTPDSIRAEVLRLARTTYSGVNHTHLSELLREREGIDIARNTLRRILVGAGLVSPRRRRPPKHRVRRQRMPREGMLIQIDGSYHRWLGEDGPQFMLLLAVDDATGKVVSALFCEYENTRDYFVLMRGLIERHGVPIALYTDRHSVFKHVARTGAPSAPTQFSRAMDELGTQMLYALSPQAKGRVERAAGTFQDRLVTELRLAGATTIEDAGVVLRDFLPHFNERFGVSAPESEVAYRPVDGGTCLDRMLCFRHSRKVAKDNTVRYRRSTLQLLPGMERPTYAGVKVDVLEGMDGQLVVEHEGQLIPSQEAPPRPNILRGVNGYPSHAPPYRNGLGSRWERVLASLDRERAEAIDGNHDSGAAKIRKKATSVPRKPTPKQIARWEAVHAAKRRGLSIRRITRETGIHRNTVRKYLKADSPPMNRPRVMLKAT